MTSRNPSTKWIAESCIPFSVKSSMRFAESDIHLKCGNRLTVIKQNVYQFSFIIAKKPAITYFPRHHIFFNYFESRILFHPNPFPSEFIVIDSVLRNSLLKQHLDTGINHSGAAAQVCFHAGAVGYISIHYLGNQSDLPANCLLPWVRTAPEQSGNPGSASQRPSFHPYNIGPVFRHIQRKGCFPPDIFIPYLIKNGVDRCQAGTPAMQIISRSDS